MSACSCRLPEERVLAVSFAGVGGQGVVLAGVILGAAAVRSGLWACQSAAYTVAARGGFARSEVLVSAKPPACPLAEELDLVVALCEPGWCVERLRLARSGLGLVEPGSAVPAGAGGGGPRVLEVPFAAVAHGAGLPRSANVVAAGVLAGLSSVVPLEHLVWAAGRHLGSSQQHAARAGYEAGRELLGHLEGLPWIS